MVKHFFNAYKCEEGYTHASVDNLRLIAEKIDELLYRPRAADNQKKILSSPLLCDSITER